MNSDILEGIKSNIKTTKTLDNTLCVNNIHTEYKIDVYSNQSPKDTKKYFKQWYVYCREILYIFIEGERLR